MILFLYKLFAIFSMNIEYVRYFRYRRFFTDVFICFVSNFAVKMFLPMSYNELFFYQNHKKQFVISKGINMDLN